MSNDSKRQKGIVPDGDWGWMVVFGSFLVTMMICIPTITFGILLEDINMKMGTTTATATWAMSILLGLSGLISPFVTIAIDTFSCRRTAIFGGLAMSVGLMLSYFATDIGTLYLTFGVCGAIGFGCNRGVAIVALGQYFDKRYGISAGLMMAGYSVSRMLFSTIILFVKFNYGYYGTHLIMGAACLNTCAGAALYQPAKWHYLKKPQEVTDKSSKPQKALEIFTVLSDKGRATTDVVKPSIVPTPIKCLDVPSANHQESPKQVVEQRSSKDSPRKSTGSKCHLSRIIRSVRATLKFSLLKNPVFLVNLTSQTLIQFVTLYSGVFMIPLSIDKEFEPLDAAFVQTVKSIAEIGGRVGIPWLFTITNTNNVWTHIIINMANGFALFAHALVKDFNTFFVTAVITGMLSGGIMVQGYHLILMTIGKERFSAAIGLCSLMQGIFTILGGPLLGFIRDRTGTLVNSYILLAALQFLSGLAWVCRVVSTRNVKKRNYYLQNGHPQK